MGCCLWSAIRGGWKAWVSAAFWSIRTWAPALDIPTSRCFKESIMAMGKDTVEGIKNMSRSNVIPIIAAIPNTFLNSIRSELISRCHGLQAMAMRSWHRHALDQWWLEARTPIFNTGYLFAQQLRHSEELLIDFRELVGEHLGENLASRLWYSQTSMVSRVG